MLRIIVIVARVFFAGLSLAGTVTQLVVSLGLGADPVDFFSYFTILSNVFISIVLLVGAVGLARGRTPSPTGDAVRAASVVYMVFVGVVWFAFLREVDLGGLRPWINTAHHIVLPIVALAEWLVWPPGRRFRWSTVATWLVVPAVYTGYSLIRGAITGWYPYPFFNPARQGYGAVAVYSLIMLVAFAVISVIIAVTGRRRNRAAVDATPAPRS